MVYPTISINNRICGIANQYGMGDWDFIGKCFQLRKSKAIHHHMYIDIHILYIYLDIHIISYVMTVYMYSEYVYMYNVWRFPKIGYPQIIHF